MVKIFFVQFYIFEIINNIISILKIWQFYIYFLNTCIHKAILISYIKDLKIPIKIF